MARIIQLGSPTTPNHAPRAQAHTASPRCLVDRACVTRLEGLLGCHFWDSSGVHSLGFWRSRSGTTDLMNPSVAAHVIQRGSFSGCTYPFSHVRHHDVDRDGYSKYVIIKASWGHVHRNCLIRCVICDVTRGIYRAYLPCSCLVSKSSKFYIRRKTLMRYVVSSY